MLVLHKPPKPEDASREGVLFWRNPAGEWQASRGIAGASGLKRHVQEYAALETALTDAYEDAADTAALFKVLEAATPLARAARNMHQALQSAREAVQGEPLLIEMRDSASDVERNFDLLLEDIRNEIQYRTVREGEEQARLSREVVRAGHRLNILAALFLPVTAIASLFGMNLPDGQTGPVFWLVVVVGFGLGAALAVWVLAKPKENEGANPRRL